MPQVGELTVFCGAMVGASIGFLWYNAHPAEVFMGDVGSLGLGGAIGTVAVVIKQELLLPFIGGVFVIEAISVMLQVGSYKLRKKRIFKMAPIHHHFELMGWSESKVIVRFWVAALVFALFALTTLKVRIDICSPARDTEKRIKAPRTGRIIGAAMSIAWTGTVGIGVRECLCRIEHCEE